jgi:cytochrome c oxidase cbb3-type subunit 3
MNMRPAVVLIVFLLGCRRESRDPRPLAPAVSRSGGVTLTELGAGSPPQGMQALSRYVENAYALSEGKRLYQAFNCVGCHAWGGGSIGPALMDERWVYGSAPAQIAATILEGRPNGMPSFRGKVADHQVAQLAAYVRSLAGLVRKDAAPGRGDSMSVKRPENMLDPAPVQRAPAEHPP